jgi:sialate O-acetylesterase
MTRLARRPYIRFAKNARTVSRTPRLDWKGVWRDFSPASFRAPNANLSAVAFYYALELFDALDIPIGIVDSSWGGTRIEPWTPPSMFQQAFSRAKRFNQATPTSLWNGMVAAWAPMAMRGFIWYQGCSNAADGSAYARKMHNLYNGWAKEFANPDLRLYFVQLAPFKRSWYQIQLAQAKFAAEQKNAAMVTTCDIGNFYDIHPNNKRTVSQRLALHALVRDYGFSGLVNEPPTVKSWRVEGSRFILTFNNASSWYVYNNDYSLTKGFALAGATGGFVPARVLNLSATADLKNPEIVLEAKGIAAPRRVRYLADSPWVGTLYSADSGLPAGPFEIDARTPADRRRPGAAAALGDALQVKELDGFRKVLSADLPEAKFTGYTFDDTRRAGAFSRVAYVMELSHRDGSVDWVVAAMDAFTSDAAKLGVPAASKAVFQQPVSHLVVRSNLKDVAEGAFPRGGLIEFFDGNYQTTCAITGAGGSPTCYDINDKQSAPLAGGYGSFQIHNAQTGKPLIAYNCFNGKGVADVGLGTNTDGVHPDWTFMNNARDFTIRRLTVLVK